MSILPANILNEVEVAMILPTNARPYSVVEASVAEDVAVRLPNVGFICGDRTTPFQ
jgi:hypothetical protein